MKPRIKTRLTNAVLVLISLAIGEAVCRVALKTILPTVEAKRTRLVGQLSKSPRFQNSVGLPYLLYGPAPGYSNIHGRQHNRAGFRGRFVPQKRTLGKKRILFLGGSTTYGWKVNKPTQSYPAQTRKLLEQKYPGQEFEVINAGLPSGSSAELLTHFHFKYRYFKPDIVVINTGGNDAYAILKPNFQADYSHWRQPISPVDALYGWRRQILRSRLASVVVIPLLFGTKIYRTSIERLPEQGPPVRWYREQSQASRHHPFINNIETLVREIQTTGATVFFAPFRISPIASYSKKLRIAINKNSHILKALAKKYQIAWIPFPQSSISTENWVDDCHLNEKGSLQKAQHFLPYIEASLDIPENQTNLLIGKL